MKTVNISKKLLTAIVIGAAIIILALIGIPKEDIMDYLDKGSSIVDNVENEEQQ